jgi:hypothetical protein
LGTHLDTFRDSVFLERHLIADVFPAYKPKDVFMPSRSARLLCVGNAPDLLRTRCAVLGSVGYDAKSAALPEAETILRTDEFDLVIVSAWLEEWEKEQIIAAVGETPALVLTELMVAGKLLAEVERILVAASHLSK